MPFNESNDVTSYYVNLLPPIDDTTRQKLPTTAQILKLEGGKPGDLGEKSYKPIVSFFQGSVNDGGDAVKDKDIHTINIKSENDCGFALKINQDANNKSEVNIGYINPSSGINIYLSSNNLQFTKLISGSVESSTSFADGSVVKDFTVSTNGTSLISSVLDTDLGLNKYYLDMNDGVDCSKFLTATISDSSSGTPSIAEPLTDLLNIYVVETDVNDKYLSYTTEQKIFTGSSGSINIESGKSFAAGDVVRIQYTNIENNYIIAIVTSYVGTLLSFSNIKYPENTTTCKILLGSFVTINNIWDWKAKTPEIPDSHCISYTRTPSTLVAQNNTTFKDYFSSGKLQGFRMQYKKEKTNLIPECRNEINWFSDTFVDVNSFANTFSSKDSTLDINRITNRDYIRSQYSGKSQLINKNKFSILFNGFYSTNDEKTSFYFNGYYGRTGNIIMKTVLKYSVNAGQPILNNNNNVEILIGNGAKFNTNGSYSPYFTMKLYEALVYKNIAGLSTGKPQRIICDYLVSKYKNKAFFDSSEIQTDAPIYYSQADRPNIFGKVQKIIS
jgi:hypothetical protein